MQQQRKSELIYWVKKSLSQQVAMNTQPHLASYLDEHLCLEQLIADLSRKFIELDCRQVNLEFDRAQKLVCEAMGFDCSVAALWDEYAKTLVVTHSWASPSFESACEFESQRLPWLASKILRGDDVLFTSSAEFPLVASTYGEIVDPLVPKSSIVFPLKARGQVFGGLAFGTFRVECEWTERTIDRLRLVSNVFSNALALQRSAEEFDKALRDANER